MSESKASSSKPRSSSKVDGQLLDALKHYDSFYEKPPPGLHREADDDRPEDVIPDTPENSAARDFLAKAPTKGLWMPLGKEVKVMKCWRCKNYGHRTGDKECPMFLSGNKDAEEFRHVHEDPMYHYVKETEIRQKMEKVEMLKSLLHPEKKRKKSIKEKKKRRHPKKDVKRKHGKDDSSDSDFSTSSSASTASSSSFSSSISSNSNGFKSKRNNKSEKNKSKKKPKHRRDHKSHKKPKRSKYKRN